MITLKKDGAIKYLDPESKLLEVLLKDGWVPEVKEEATPKKGKKVKSDDDSL